METQEMRVASALELEARMAAIEQQRNNALTEVVLLRGILATRDATIAAMGEQLKALMTKPENDGTVKVPEIDAGKTVEG